ncbi:hypothetical protein Ancab_013979 [Ancistrocladus abbreviatus]
MPTASFEASWTSQSGLLSHPHGLAAVSIKNLPGSSNDKNIKSSSKWFPLRCRCPGTERMPCRLKKQSSESKSPKTFHFRSSNSGGYSAYTNRQRITSPRSSTAYAAAKGTVSSPHDQSNRNDFVIRSKSDQSMLINAKPDRNGFLSNRNHQIVASGRSFADNNGTTSNGFTFLILNNSTFR